MALKNNLIEALSKDIDYISRTDIITSVDIVIDYLKEQLIQENRVEIRGFGSFSIRKRRKASCNNVSYNTIYFRMAKTIAEKLNKL